MGYSLLFVSIGTPIFETLSFPVLAVLNLDPFFIYQQVLFKQTWSKIIVGIFLIIRLLIMLLTSKLFGIHIRFGFILLLSQGVFSTKLIKHLGRINFDMKAVRIYRQLQVHRCLLRETEQLGLASGLAVLSVTLIASINGAILAVKLGRTMFAVICLGISVIFILSGSILFTICCLTYENSLKALRRWKTRPPNLILKNKYWSAILRSCRVVSCPVGNIGVLDHEIKANYSTFILIYTVDFMIATPTIYLGK